MASRTLSSGMTLTLLVLRGVYIFEPQLTLERKRRRRAQCAAGRTKRGFARGRNPRPDGRRGAARRTSAALVQLPPKFFSFSEIRCRGRERRYGSRQIPAPRGASARFSVLHPACGLHLLVAGRGREVTRCDTTGELGRAGPDSVSPSRWRWARRPRPTSRSKSLPPPSALRRSSTTWTGRLRKGPTRSPASEST